jgi:hypothetical protein
MGQRGSGEDATQAAPTWEGGEGVGPDGEEMARLIS